MATEAECLHAIEGMLAELSAVDPEVRKGKFPNRTVGVHLLDLDKTFVGDLRGGEIINVRLESGAVKPQIRLVCKSDDLLRLTDGDMSFAHAWATGQIRLDATIRDLFRLRKLGG